LVPAIRRELREYEGRQARRQAEQLVAENERRFRALIENALDIITVIDQDLNIVYVSPSLRTVLGYSPEDSVGKSFLAFVHEEDRPQLRQLGEEMFTTPGLSKTVSFRHRHLDGRWRVLEAMGKRLDAFGTGVVVNSRDVTERQLAEEALRQSNVRLEQALEELRQTQDQVVRQERLRALGEMASGIVHDFNNALSSILGFSETLLMYPDLLEDRDQTVEFLQMINTAAQDAGGIVERLGEFYRNREKNEAFAQVDLARVVEQTISLTQPKWKGQARADGRVIRVNTQLAEDSFIFGDESELRQALTNLTFNAVDAMPEGGTLTFETRLEEDRVVLRVGDTGTGMTEETQQRCLEPFFTTKGQKGTGMGLAMVYGIIRRHLGEVSIDSRYGEGTTFLLSFPKEYLVPSHESEPSGENSFEQRPLNVLVVEEEPLVRKVISTYLQGDGHIVLTAETGSQALQLLPEGFDLVVLSSILPDTGGELLAERVKAQHPTTSVLLLCGFGSESQSPSVDAVVSKPFTLSAFRTALGQLFGSVEVKA
ncbi:MAG: PAS domain S-box protein, partial [Candidatus Eremiobacteraeota bacterium]|nr:PAS domain S-box protein [Candidatus Eremiobacteraeota bacterium]